MGDKITREEIENDLKNLEDEMIWYKDKIRKLEKRKRAFELLLKEVK